MTDGQTSSDRQNAVRLLACINAASRAPTKGASADIVGQLRAQSRLQALDFWMRNPDYLANELLNDFEESGDVGLLAQAQAIFDSREPDLRRVPMIRFHFGAFEPLDNALASLRSADLIRIRREGAPGQIREHVYLLTARGRRAMDDLAALAPEIDWYRQRAAIVASVAGEAGGKALKDRQYLQQEYAETALNHVIAPITERVRERLEKISGGTE
jgi:DNA-binding PadR family transcriptional regulator